MTSCASAADFRFLPIGAIKPRGWMRELLAKDVHGITGHLNELSPHAARDVFASQRISSTATAGWWDAEVVGNWLDGLIRLAVLIEDEALTERASAVVAQLLASQDEDGYLGAYDPARRWQRDGPNGELWSQSRLFLALLGWQEATGDPRVLEALRRAADVTMAHYPARRDGRTYFDTSAGTWDGGRTHGLMIIEPLLRIAELTGDPRLVDFACFLYEDYSAARLEWLDRDVQLACLADERTPFAGHGAHVCEHVRIPLLLYAHTGDPRYQLAFRAALRKLLPNLGVSGACKSDETLGLAELGGVPLPESGYEYCATTELMLSWQQAALTCRDMAFADHAEMLMLNAAQGARLADGRAVGYTAADNQYAAEAGLGTRWKYSPTHDDVATCCAANAGRLWPYVVSRMAARVGERGLAVLFYGPSEITHTVDGIPVVVEQDTAFPFEDMTRLRIHASRPSTFPLTLRLPAWADRVTARLNGKDLPVEPSERQWSIERTWRDGDRLDVSFTPAVELVPAADRSVAVRRGPLLYALPVPSSTRTVKHYPVGGFADREFIPVPSARWDYTLQVSSGGMPATFIADRGQPSSKPDPWDRPPIRIRVTALDARSAAPDDDDDWIAPGLACLDLVPMGCTVLRRTCFPVVDRPPLARASVPDAYRADRAGHIEHANQATGETRSETRATVVAAVTSPAPGVDRSSQLIAPSRDDTG